MAKPADDYLCPLVSCNRRGPHSHIACEKCGAVQHGNITCLVCLRWHKRTGGGESWRVLIHIMKRREGWIRDGLLMP